MQETDDHLIFIEANLKSVRSLEKVNKINYSGEDFDDLEFMDCQEFTVF